MRVRPLAFLGIVTAFAACGGDLGSSDDSGGDSSDGGVDSAIEADAAAPVDATAVSDASQERNACGGHALLELDGAVATPGGACGACNDGTVVCDGTDSLVCAGASTTPCPDAGAPPAVDAGGPTNACGGHHALVFASSPAAPGDACPCGFLACATIDTLSCAQSRGASCSVDAGADTCLIPAAAYTAVAAATPTLPAETRPVGTSTDVIAYDNNDLLSDPFDGLLYVTIPNGFATIGNTVTLIDPKTRAVVQNIPVGAEPTRLALSDDGHVLWVVASSAYEIESIDTTTRTVTSKISFPTDQTVSDIDVIPGTERSLVVTMHDRGDDSGARIFVFDDGVPRRFSYQLGDELAQTTTTYAPELAYAIGNDLDQLCIDSNGVFVRTTDTSIYLQQFASPYFADNVLYLANGEAYDIATSSVIGTYAFGPTLFAAYPTEDSSDRVYYLVETQKPGTIADQIWSYDRSTFAYADRAAVPSFFVDAPLVRWGRYGFAYRSSNDGIAIVRSSMIPDTP